MNKPELFSTKWRWCSLAIFNLAAIILLAGWLWQPTRQLWDALDAQVFHLLNARLANSALWAHIWGIGNMRPVDAGVGVVLLSLLIKRDFIFAGTQLRRAAFAFLALILMLLLVRFSFDAVLKILHWNRTSPSLVIPDAVRLTQLFPDWVTHWYLKDSSEQCFPGDHASVLLIWAMLATGFVRGWKLFLVWGLALFFMLPRLVAGAHWASDDFVGGVFLAFVAFGWGYYSPYVAKVSAWLERLCTPLLSMLNKVPLLNRLSVISGV